MKNTVFALSFALLLAAGCTEDPSKEPEREPLDASEYIAVTTAVADGEEWTRGTPISSQTEMLNFGLFCSYTGGADWTPDDPHDKIDDRWMIKSGSPEGSRDYWTYADGDPVRWETGAGASANDRYTFFAYAPYRSNPESLRGISVVPPDDVVDILGADAGRPYIKYMVPLASFVQPDLMIASRRENIRPTGNPVALTMHHALAAVGFRVIGNGEAISRISVTGFADKGVVELDGDNIVWNTRQVAADGSLLSTPAAQAPLTTALHNVNLMSGAVASASGEVMHPTGWLMMIPQTLGEEARVNVTFSDGTPEINLSLDTRQWTAGTRVEYTIKVSEPLVRPENPVGEVPIPSGDGIYTTYWAGSNLSAKGVFADNATDYGALFQWGRDTAWPVADYSGTGTWPAEGNDQHAMSWPAATNPCPTGWRLPTRVEWNRFLNVASPRPTNAGDRTFTSSYGSIVLPAPGIVNGSPQAMLLNPGTRGSYWAFEGLGDGSAYNFTWTNTGNAGMYGGGGDAGFSVRCVHGVVPNPVGQMAVPSSDGTHTTIWARTDITTPGTFDIYEMPSDILLASDFYTYTWDQASADGMCPDNWRLPTAQEFYDLTAYVDAHSYDTWTSVGTMTPAGGGYYSPNPRWSEEDPGYSPAYIYMTSYDENDYSQPLFFSALPNATTGSYWSSTETGSSTAYAMSFSENDIHPATATDKTNAHLVRCVHDQQ